MIKVYCLVLLLMSLNLNLKAVNTEPKYEEAVFAGGCFWCMEPPFEKLDGVKSVIVGYTGGNTANPTYEEVSAGKTGHVEAVLVTYDPVKISYSELLKVFWKQIDPTDGGGEFVDRGSQYRSVIFYRNEEQRKLAQESKEELSREKIFLKPIVTEILPLKVFYKAEEYHQQYYKKSSLKYKYYRYLSGRDQFINSVWRGKMEKEKTIEKKDGRYSKTELKKLLTAMQYKVTQENGTEPAFKNEYWDNHNAGIYVDIVSGEPLFSSLDKYDSGTGWPSFTKPLEPSNIVERVDRSLFSERTEVRSKLGDSHLGHVFNDGPKPTGLRYCMNSAALRFVPEKDLEKEGYGKYKALFKK